MTNPFKASRRGFLAGGVGAGLLAAAGAGVAAHANLGAQDSAAPSNVGGPRPIGQESMVEVPFEQLGTVRIGLVGLGNRGHSMASGWARQPGAHVVAVCDIRDDRAQRTADTLQAETGTRPATYGGSADSYQKMYAEMDLDLVYVASPWEFHYAQARDALLAGAHAMVELPVAMELDELWSLVDTSEQTRKHLMLAENCSYGRNELAMLKMAHEGVFGDVHNGHGGYLHDLRSLLFADGYYTDDWRRLWHTRLNASFYPMHGLAPIAAAMDINRGDRFTTLSATATPAKGLADYRERYVSRNHHSWNETYVNGDLITCMMTTDMGRIVRAEHDVSTPRPYSRINSLAGTRGLMEDYVGSGSGARIYMEPDHTDHGWRDFGSYRNEYDHWLWTEVGGQGGHGGMDGLMQWRTIQLMRTGGIPDIDVYDSVAWCSPVPLSAASLALGGQPVEVPDFTRGDWKFPRLGLDSQPGTMPGA
ncbi:Gfo/Idh/MocA family protein [Tessaracoccus sp. MC1756]|uniref:Gfo/Idh/MocA family protein n=1 Tax=Tessaracoccus sp. MC1756 TaxID=2760311 RepID=UPI00351BFA74